MAEVGDTQVETLVEYSEAVASNWELLQKDHKRKQLVLERWVLDHGREFEWAAFPEDEIPLVEAYTEFKGCYGNAFKLALDYADELIYCEGYACSTRPCGFVVPHAWAVTPEGVVLDPTWEKLDHTKEPAYFGVPFRLEAVREVVLQSESYGILQNWRSDQRIFKGEWPVEEWRHPIGAREMQCVFCKVHGKGESLPRDEFFFDAGGNAICAAHHEEHDG